MGKDVKRYFTNIIPVTLTTITFPLPQERRGFFETPCMLYKFLPLLLYLIMCISPPLYYNFLESVDQNPQTGGDRLHMAPQMFCVTITVFLNYINWLPNAKL